MAEIIPFGSGVREDDVWSDVLDAIREGARQGTADAQSNLLRYPRQAARAFDISERQVKKTVADHRIRLRRLDGTSVRYVKRDEFAKHIKLESVK